MAVLVTRPRPDDETTAAGLRARGFEVLRAPMLRFEPVTFHDDEDAAFGAVIVTSANALRGIAPHLQEPHLKASRLLKLPLSRGADQPPPPPPPPGLKPGSQPTATPPALPHPRLRPF